MTDFEENTENQDKFIRYLNLYGWYFTNRITFEENREMLVLFSELKELLK